MGACSGEEVTEDNGEGDVDVTAVKDVTVETAAEKFLALAAVASHGDTLSIPCIQYA